MSGVWALQGLTYLGILVFVVIVARKAIRYASAPMHLRWEIYPVPHEVGKSYGGSYMEETDWWKKPRETTLIGELGAMIPEMLFLVALLHHNKKMWALSFPFHGGLYLSIGFVLLLLLGGVVQALGVPVTAGPDALLFILYWLTIIVGVLGMIAVVLGALGLLAMRTFGEEMRRYSTPADYFNLIFILLIAASGLVAWLTVDLSFDQLRSFVQGLVSLNPAAAINPLIGAEVVLLALFLIYMPFTHMTHFVGKYFTYHAVRWDDTPNFGGVAYEKQLQALLTRKVSWSAPHVGSGRSWVEVATKEVQQ